MTEHAAFKEQHLGDLINHHSTPTSRHAPGVREAWISTRASHMTQGQAGREFASSGLLGPLAFFTRGSVLLNRPELYVETEPRETGIAPSSGAPAPLLAFGTFQSSLGVRFPACPASAWSLNLPLTLR